MPIGAIFDLDGTIIDCSSEKEFVKHLLITRGIPFHNWLHWCVSLIRRCSLVAAKANKVYLRGQSVPVIHQKMEQLFQHKLFPHISPRAFSLIEQHRQQGHLTFLLSGSLDYFVQLFCEHLEMDSYVGFQLEIQESQFTGETLGVQPYAQGKAAIVKQLAEKYALDLKLSYAYGNHATDARVLELVGNPVAVNPDRGLIRTAQAQGWAIEWFHPQHS